MKGVFDVKPNSQYDDDIVRRYHFPGNRTYLANAQSFVGDWVLYREPQRNGGRRAYIAAAHVDSVEPDLAQPGYFYANVSAFQPFPALVPLVRNGRYAEAALRAIDPPSRVGAALQGKSIRSISDEDFGAIVLEGYGKVLTFESTVRLGIDLDFPDPSFGPGIAGFAESVHRPIEQILLNKKIRDAAFRDQVCDAYDSRCAVTRLRIINGGGRAEVEAAHIRPVEHGGPDIPQNGVALSKTVHWLFDRHLISITDDYRLLVADNRVPSELRGLFPRSGEPIHLPKDPKLRPSPVYLADHRERFAGAGY